MGEIAVVRKGPGVVRDTNTDIFAVLGEALRQLPAGVKEQYSRVLDGLERNPAISAEDNKHANQMLERAFAHQLDDANQRSNDGMHFEASRRFIRLADLAVALEHMPSEIKTLRTRAVKELIRTADQVIELDSRSLIAADSFLEEARGQIAKLYPETPGPNVEILQPKPAET